MDLDCDNFVCGTSPSISEAANEALNLLPERSREKYEREYIQFMEYRKVDNINSYSERVMLAYFTNTESNKLKPSTLWSKYSMLKATLLAHHNVDISTYSKLKALLKRKSVGYLPKKSKIFDHQQIHQFINQAPDENYLVTKVVVIFGISGACRASELCQLTTNDIKDIGSKLLITIPDETLKPRSFIVNETYYNVCQKYIALRPNDLISDRFFFAMRNGKAIKHVVGIHAFGRMPKSVAKYLGLPNPQTYTGHAFRKTSATIDTSNKLLPSKIMAGRTDDRNSSKPSTSNSSSAKLTQPFIHLPFSPLIGQCTINLF